MANTRIKIRRDVLLARLQSERARLGVEYETAEFEYDQRMVAFLPRLEDELEKWGDLLATDTDKALERISSGYEGGKVSLAFPKLKLPLAPKLDTGNLDRMIRFLEIADEESISIAADDQYARYL